MFQLLQTMVICLTLASVVLPVAFLVALSMPQNSEMRQMCMRICYWGCVLLAVGYFAMPIDCIPDLLFPVGFADDAVALGMGYVAARKAMRPNRMPGVN